MSDGILAARMTFLGEEGLLQFDLFGDWPRVRFRWTPDASPGDAVWITPDTFELVRDLPTFVTTQLIYQRDERRKREAKA